MANFCEKYIVQDIIPNCDNPMTKGAKSTATLINRADIEKITRSAENPNIITSIALKSGKKGYKVIQLGKKPFNGTTTALQANDNGNTVNKTVTIRILDAGPDIAQNVLNPLLNSDFVLILQNNYTGDGGKAKYEVIGAEQGLSVSAFDRDIYSEDAQSGYTIALTEEGAPSVALYLWAESESATDELIEGIVGA